MSADEKMVVVERARRYTIEYSVRHEGVTYFVTRVSELLHDLKDGAVDEWIVRYEIRAVHPGRVQEEIIDEIERTFGTDEDDEEGEEEDG